MGNLQNVRDVDALEVFPIEQLEGDLEIEGQAPQPTQEKLLFFAVDHDLRWRGIEDHQAVLVEVSGGVLLSPSVAVAQQLLARDRKQKCPETRVAPKALAGVDAAEERLLYEVVDIPTHLVAKEPVE